MDGPTEGRTVETSKGANEQINLLNDEISSIRASLEVRSLTMPPELVAIETNLLFKQCNIRIETFYAYKEDSSTEMDSFDCQMQKENAEPLFEHQSKMKRNLRRALDDLENHEKKINAQQKPKMTKGLTDIPFYENGR